MNRRHQRFKIDFRQQNVDHRREQVVEQRGPTHHKAYAFALIAILFTALSYGKLVRRYPSAGSAYTYAQTNTHDGIEGTSASK
jgi:hypothetical protein